MQRKLIFRADANVIIGRGHISRCLAIASMLKDAIAIVFVCLQCNKTYVTELIGDFNSEFIEKEDDLFTIVRKEDLLWIDGYHFTEAWKKNIQQKVYKLIETNDIPYIPKYIDVLFNHTPGLINDQFGGKESSAKLHLGLEYALLRQQFLINARTISPVLKREGVFICFGGADTYNLGEKFINELMQQNFKEPIYWVANTSTIIKEKYINTNVNILSNLSEDKMIHYMSNSKVNLIPSSVLSFEAMALRKPIFTCYFVDNQKLINKGLLYEKLASGVAYVELNKDVKNATNNFLTYYDDSNLHNEQVQKQNKLLDGNSGDRIKKIIINL